MDDDKPAAYDGFGAPIYPHQEAPMPTNLPDNFKGTKPAEKKLRDYSAWQNIAYMMMLIFMVVGAIDVAAAIAHALVHLIR